jgi:hypothetical protein
VSVGLGGHAGGFVDHEEVIVFVEDGDVHVHGARYGVGGGDVVSDTVRKLHSTSIHGNGSGIHSMVYSKQ